MYEGNISQLPSMVAPDAVTAFTMQAPGRAADRLIVLLCSLSWSASAPPPRCLWLSPMLLVDASDPSFIALASRCRAFLMAESNCLRSHLWACGTCCCRKASSKVSSSPPVRPPAATGASFGSRLAIPFWLRNMLTSVAFHSAMSSGSEEGTRAFGSEGAELREDSEASRSEPPKREPPPRAAAAVICACVEDKPGEFGVLLCELGRSRSVAERGDEDDMGR
mmetsp:Transcript_6645/g.21503  ORF Transcript_6645/g.21503 Transcript_6645/m.21503 type:complete len:222 (+) Transcript_6645:5203-5868(+)